MRLYTKITDEPVQEIPSHDSSHGSPPSDFQPFNCGGLFRALYIDRSTWTAEHIYNNYNPETFKFAELSPLNEYI